MARMGAVVFSYNMFAWGGESIRQLDTLAIIEKPTSENIWKHHETPLALTLQTWSSMRALDFLQSLPDVDPGKIGVTGASGGGTKPLLLISDGDDWTKTVQTLEYPFIKRTYSFYGAEDYVESVYFPEGVHDYGFKKRIPVYHFMAKHLGLK